MSMALLGMYGGPWGAAVSVSYFGGKFLYEEFSGHSLFQKPVNQ